MTTRDLARNLGVSEVTARRRLKRLLDNGIIRVVAVVSPDHLNTQLHAVVSLKADVRRVKDIANHLASFPEVRFVSIVTGTHNVHITVSMKDSNELMAFITQKVGNIEGVMSAEAVVSMKVVKSAYNWIASDSQLS